MSRELSLMLVAREASDCPTRAPLFPYNEFSSQGVYGDLYEEHRLPAEATTQTQTDESQEVSEGKAAEKGDPHDQQPAIKPPLPSFNNK